MENIEAPPSEPVPAPPPPLLQLERVEKRYGAFRPALLGLDLAVGPGEFVVIEGPGACGKSVLLRLLAGIEAPSGGIIRIAGENLARLRPRALAQLRRSMGILPAADALLERRSVLENVALAASLAGSGGKDALARARAALELVGLDVNRYGQQAVARLAGGQRHCVALARALVNRPALLLLDDLAAPLDAGSASRVLEAVDGFSQAGVTVLATRRVDEGEAAAVPARWPARSRVLRLRDGAIAP